MTSDSTGGDMHSAARAWVLKLASGSATATDAAALRAWIAENSGHKIAFERARQLWQESEALEHAFRREPEMPERIVRRRRVLAVAASIALLIATPVISTLYRLSTADFRSPVGEVTRLQLPDGSSVWLDSGSALDERFSEARRDVELLKGRVFFEVSHDPARPFVVKAGDGSVTAVGTAFSVSRERRGAVVSVEEGRVRVASGQRDRLLVAGNKGGWSDAGDLSNEQAVGSEMPDSWRWGRIVIQNQPLETAVAELDRYYPGIIFVLARQNVHVSGRFDIHRVESGLNALAESQALKVTHWGPWITVLSQ
ncbi:MAG: FecR domain-containing protein [Gammaproteobacteria bacterium]